MTRVLKRPAMPGAGRPAIGPPVRTNLRPETLTNLKRAFTDPTTGRCEIAKAVRQCVEFVVDNPRACARPCCREEEA